MATIVNQNTYGPGHKLELRKTANKIISAKIKSAVELSAPVKNPDEILDLGTGTEFIYIKYKQKIFKIVGSKSGINNSFNHAGGGKSDTHKTTRCKEAMSLIVFDHYQRTSGVIEEDVAISKLSKYDADKKVYRSVYYASAVLQLSSFKKIKNMKRMHFEFQGDKYSKVIYSTAKKLGGPSSADNWNPADLWVFDESFKTKVAAEVSAMTKLNELNIWIKKNFIEGKVIPISLKQATNRSTMEIVDPVVFKNKKLNYDFDLANIQIAGSVKSVFVETKSGFTFKANARAAKDNPNLFYEGTMKGENFSMGAISKDDWTKYSGSKVPPGKTIRPTSQLLNRSLATFKKYESKISHKDNDILWNPRFVAMDNLLQQRYIHVADFLKFIMENYDETIRFGFFSSMKISDDNSMYVKIK